MRRAMVLAALVVARWATAPQAFATTAADICAPSADPCIVSSTRAVAPGSVLDFGARRLELTSSGSLVVSGGLMTIEAGSVRLQSKGSLVGLAAGGTSASIKVTAAGDIAVETGSNGAASIDVTATSSPGQIELVAGGNVTIAGKVAADATGSQESGGTIDVVADGTVNVLGTMTARGGTTFGLGGAITIRGASVTTAGSIRVDAGDGGDIDIESVSGALSAGGTLNASGGGNFGDGGSVTLLASSNLGLGATVSAGAAGSDLEGGGTGGDVAFEATTGTVTVSGTVDNHGASPDGDGGEVDVTAGLDYVQTGSFLTQGNGADSCGGFVGVEAGRLASFVGDVTVEGGFCGGDVDASAATISVGAASDLVADGGEVAGSVTLAAESITVNGKLRANGTSSTGTGGIVELAGCTLGLPSGSSIKTDGDQGYNLLQASGQLTLGGQVSSRPTGRNRFEYRDPALPPVTLGTASILPARECAPAPGCLTPTLPACAAAAVCGNGVREAGEGCDDANTVACDGCSPVCQSEGCGNGAIECGEECDDGPANGGPGNPCDAGCHVVQGGDTIFVPSSRRGRGCMLEWALQNEPVSGFPPSAIACIDGDPACDADGVTDGSCTFRAAACLNVTDARIPDCGPTAVEFVNLRRPSATSPDDAVEAANAAALVPAIEALGVTVRSRRTVLQTGTPESAADRCSAPVALRVPHPPGGVGRRLLSAGAGDVAGRTVSNRIALSCAFNPAICGNGDREIGEQCDDGNAAACDGCSETCRLERCGDGVVQCGEQCDDGASNGQAGAPCTGACTEAPPSNRIPGGRGSRDCFVEWALATAALQTSRSGLPTTKQICVDNTECDFDPTPGVCRLHLWACLAGDDARIGCVADGASALALLKPTATQTGPAAAARTALLGAFDELSFPLGPGETCSRRIDLEVPAGRTKLQVKAEATSVGGAHDRDTLKLACAPAGTVLRAR